MSAAVVDPRAVVVHLHHAPGEERQRMKGMLGELMQVISFSLTTGIIRLEHCEDLRVLRINCSLICRKVCLHYSCSELVIASSKAILYDIIILYFDNKYSYLLHLRQWWDLGALYPWHTLQYCKYWISC